MNGVPMRYVFFAVAVLAVALGVAGVVLGEADDLVGLYLYAIVATVIAVTVLIWLTRLSAVLAPSARLRASRCLRDRARWTAAPG